MALSALAGRALRNMGAGLAGEVVRRLQQRRRHDAWRRIRTAVVSGKLAAAKVSTALISYGRYAGRFVICVYSRTWRDDAEINQSRDVLAELGFTGEHVLRYKRDIETTRGVYGGPEEWYPHW